MGENNRETSCSWRKMVITKTEDKYVSALKSDQTDDLTMDTRNFILSEEEDPYISVKVERAEARDTSVSSTFSSNYDEGADGSFDLDPLSEGSTPKRRKRKGSVNASILNESPLERATRLAKMSAYAAERLSRETPEQRSARLQRMSEYAAKRLAEETSEQRARRLARMSAYAAKRLASETPEQRQTRLSRMSAYAAKRQAMKKYVKAHEEND